MTISRTIKRFAVVCAALGTLSLWSADSPFGFDLKLRGGVAGGSLQTNLGDNKMFGFGVEGRYSLRGPSALTAELSYDVFGARWRDVTPSGGAVWMDPNSAIPDTTGAVPTTTWHGAPLTLSNAKSIDYRKEALQGFSLKVGYTNALPWFEGMTWKAGLSLDAYKVQSEFTGTLVPLDASPQGDGTDIDPEYYEGWAFTKSKTKLGLGAYAGVGMTLNENLRIEFNLRSVATGHYDYHPFTYTGKPAFLEEKTRQAVAFEIALALKL